MLYPILTVTIGSLMVVLSIFSIRRALMRGAVFLNAFRFLISGALLIVHFPLTDLISHLVRGWLIDSGTTPVVAGVDLPFWGAVTTLVFIQVIVLPTSRELYWEAVRNTPFFGVRASET